MDKEKAREHAMLALRMRGYQVADVSSGQGVPKNSRLNLSKNGEQKTALVKVSTGGRISFVRSIDGSYPVLDSADFVVYAKVGANSVALSFFKASDVRDAFEENHASLVAKQRGHIPHWINPEFEPGWRFVGSGFGPKALWTEALDEPPRPEASENHDPVPVPRSGDRESLISRLKEMVAAEVGVPASAIEIDLRIKL